MSAVSLKAYGGCITVGELSSVCIRSLMTSSRNGSKTTCITMLYTTEQIPHLGVVIPRAEKVLEQFLDDCL